MKTTTITKTFFTAACLLGSVTSSLAQFTQTGKVVSQDRESRAEYGTSVDIKENYAIVGASRETIAAGAAYIYEQNRDGEWQNLQKLTAFDAQDMAEFGGASKFGEDYLVVASGRGDVDGIIRAGALYVYNLNSSNGTWDFDVKLHAADYSGDAKLGMNPTSLDVDGSTILGGAPGENGWTGAAYVFEKESGNWVEKQKLVSPNTQTNETFGIGVSISGDVVAIGANETDNRKGSVYIFQKDASGTWEYFQQVMASDAAADAFFGSSVSLHEDQLVVGAYGANGEAGAAYIFEKDSSGDWQEMQKLTGATASESAQFGWSAEIKEKHLVVSAPHAYGFDSGELYFYKKDANGVWQEEEIIQGEDTVGEDFYGWSVALYGDQIITGAPWEDHDATGDNEVDRAGSAYIFRDELLLGNEPGNDQLENRIGVYPVPAVDEITIQSKESSISNIVLINQLGMMVKEQKVSEKKESTLTISDISEGVYFLNIIDTEGKITTKKIVKSK
ncbi:T9SS type A sorting domain-containing protein [Marixanthomonas ophiurae]|uniref:T9SS C-terminal target domain-containing protein n=1 Tax=Marixanthomonas ophiurae TaxID=387659 RepID=A0A3E1Q6Q3_9FLAO|nr:T9SS type A sorting domain-containing protein [Marixanthomonas ophiurae]RFN57806.1 T9SS C-terminal target domain-containing protein [Marixanthomonas ophiurae]